MGALLSKISGWKTYFLGASAILAAIAGYLSGALTVAQLVEAIFAALGTMTIRHAITTTVSNTADKKL